MVSVTKSGPASKPGPSGQPASDRPSRNKPSFVEIRANNLPGRNTSGDRIVWGKDTKLRNQVQLSTYPDCIGGDLAGLERFVKEKLEGVIGGIHVLPFYPSSADRGFAPLHYQEVDPRYGDWGHVERIAEDKDFCADFMVNHVSAQSKEFKDYLAKGDESEYADMFIRYDKFWNGEPTEEQLAQIFTRKPSPPVIEVELEDGTKRQLWCTFKEEQIDIDVFSEPGKRFIKEQLDSLCQRGAHLIRLDAFGYTTKKRDTNCFFVEPETWQLLDQVNDIVKEHETELLCEVHEHYFMQKKLSEHGLWVYDFALPMLTIQALYDGCGNNLKTWLHKCPRNQITTLDTHDGIGVIDVAELMNKKEVDRTMKHIKDNGANENLRHSAAGEPPDVYQLNCSYYSAVGERDAWYLLARGIQMFVPGIPLVYYVGLLAGSNDYELSKECGSARDINRHRYSVEEAEEQLERPIVKLLFQLFRFRNNHPAFNGVFTLLDTIDAIQSGLYEAVDGEKPVKPTAERDNQFLCEVVGVPDKIINCSKCGCHDNWDTDEWLQQNNDDLSNGNGTNGASKSNGASGSNGNGAESESDSDGSFKPFSAALAHQRMQEGFKCPADQPCDEQQEMHDAKQEAIKKSKAMQRNPERDLPAYMLCMEWRQGQDWVVLEANLKTKEMRILYVDPLDRDIKVWNVSKCLEAAL